MALPPPSITYTVRSPKGLKPFAKDWGEGGAREFAEAQRALPNGWAEVHRVTTEIIERKR